MLLSVPPSGPPVLQGHVGRIEEHVGVIVVITEVAQVGLHVAHLLRVVLPDPGPVTQPRLQRQLGKKAECPKLNWINSKIGVMSVFYANHALRLISKSINVKNDLLAFFSRLNS